MIGYAPFLGQVRLVENRASLNLGQQTALTQMSLGLLANRIDSLISNLPEGQAKKDLSLRIQMCRGLVYSATTAYLLANAQNCLLLVQEDVAKAGTQSSAGVQTPSESSGGIPTFVYVAVGVGILGIIVVMNQ